MMIDNEIMNMEAHMLIEIVLCVSKPSKQVQVCLNNHTYRATTQHSNSIIRIIKNLYNRYIPESIQLYIYLRNTMNKKSLDIANVKYR